MISLTFSFQFQYGAIEGIVPFETRAALTAFQFQYGAIEGASAT